MSSYWTYRAFVLLGIAAALAGCIEPVRGQDVHFAQFHNTPLVVDPALAGSGEGDQRVALAHRQQWTSIGVPFRTQYFSYDLPVLRDRLGGRYIGVGLSAFTDKAGTTGFGDTQGALSVAYALRMGERSTVALGMQAAYGQRSAVLEGLRWDSQYNGAGYDPSLPTNELITNQRRSFMDLAAGLMARGELRNGVSWLAGASSFHLTQPSVDLLSGRGDRLLRRYMAHCEVRIPGQRWTWSPRAMVAQQGGTREILYGAMMHRRIGQDSRFTTDKNSSALHLGCFHRWGDAVIPTLQFEWKRKLVAGLSYDVNIGKLRTQTGFRGGAELSLQWIGMFKDTRVRLPNSKG